MSHRVTRVLQRHPLNLATSFNKVVLKTESSLEDEKPMVNKGDISAERLLYPMVCLSL